MSRRRKSKPSAFLAEPSKKSVKRREDAGRVIHVLDELRKGEGQ